jgi:cell division septation protein DedD
MSSGAAGRGLGRMWAAAAASLLLVPAVLRAQEDPAVRAAVALAAEGRSDSARMLVDRALRSARPGDPAWVEALYWRARLAVSGDSAERDLRRVAIEYPSSPWADDALLELAQLALAAGNPSSAYELASRLRSDYPGSDLRPRAALWAARASFDAGDPRTACRLLDSARTAAAADVEFVNQVAYYQGRCTTAVLAVPARPAPDTPAPSTISPPATPAAAPAPDTGGASPGWFVQAYAARQPEEARNVARRLTGARLPARVLDGADGYFRVRVGPYATEAAARDALARVRRTAGGSPFIVRQR